MRKKISLLGLRLLHKKKKPKLVKILNKRFYICPNVFDPRFIFTTKIFIKNMRIPKNSKVLDMGTGSGIIAVFAAKKAKKVLAVDINPAAVKCAKENAKLNRLKNVTARKSNLFSNIKEKFDLILFNLPYIKGKSKTMLEKAWFDENTINRFLKKAKTHLKCNGKIQIIYSNLGNIKNFEKQIKKYNYHSKIIASKNMLVEKFIFYELS